MSVEAEGLRGWVLASLAQVTQGRREGGGDKALTVKDTSADDGCQNDRCQNPCGTVAPAATCGRAVARRRHLNQGRGPQVRDR